MRSCTLDKIIKGDVKYHHPHLYRAKEQTKMKNREVNTMKTNTKKARENVKAYIMNYARDDAKKPTFDETAQTIFDEFRKACWSCDNDYHYYRTEQTAFAHWASGLPSSLDCCYFYNRSAVDDLGAILEQTETEKARYAESESEELLTYLIYREIKNAIK